MLFTQLSDYHFLFNMLLIIISTMQMAVSDEVAILLIGVLRKPPHGQYGIAGDGQVADRVEQRAVEVEDDEFGIHFPFLIFQPMAATRSDISGETILKMQ